MRWVVLYNMGSPAYWVMAGPGWRHENQDPDGTFANQADAMALVKRLRSEGITRIALSPVVELPT